MKTSLTIPRLTVMERALKARLKAEPPIAKEDRQHYEKALQWVREQRAKRGKIKPPRPTSAR
jgi:hypothetical protein